MKAPQILALALVLTGCGDQLASPASVTTPVPAAIASLGVSGSVTQTDGIVTFTARLNASSTPKRAGAYSARVEYDPSVITYVGEGATTSGLVAFNNVSGVLKVAGATLDGYTNGVLFNARFRVTRPSAAAELRLVIDELRDVNAGDRLPADLTARTALLRPWK